MDRLLASRCLWSTALWTMVKQDQKGHLQLEDLCCVLLLAEAGAGGRGRALAHRHGTMESSSQLLDLWVWQVFQVQQTKDAQGGGKWWQQCGRSRCLDTNPAPGRHLLWSSPLVPGEPFPF